MIGKAAAGVAIHPLTPERWSDLEDLFGPERGGNSGCWCMWPRIARAHYAAMEKADRKAAFHAIVRSGAVPGLIAYEGDKPIGWCAVGPRASVARFNSARASRPIETGEARDARLVYAITCFFVRTGYRKLGLTRRLASAAVEFARLNGAEAVEACTIDADRPLIWGDGFVGVSSVFASLGFREIARRSPRRPLMRFELDRDSLTA
jgi:GNAT superfamily N-acetyltransferase